MDLKDKTIIITGGGRGLGAAMALRLAGNGSKLALIDLDAEQLEESANNCRAAGSPDVATWTANVASETEVEQVFDDIAGKFGALHGLINNAGITRDGFTLKYRDGELEKKMTLEQWQLVIDVNLTGSFLCGREAAAKMIELDCAGCIINISSMNSRNAG